MGPYQQSLLLEMMSLKPFIPMALRLIAISAIAATELPMASLRYSGQTHVSSEILALNLTGNRGQIIHAGKGGVAW